VDVHYRIHNSLPHVRILSTQSQPVPSYPNSRIKVALKELLITIRP